MFPTRLVPLLAVCLAASAQFSPAADSPQVRSSAGVSPAIMAGQVDRAVDRWLATKSIQPTGPCNDVDFLRRITLDASGQLPTPPQVLAFGLNARPQKRSELIAKLVESTPAARNWARYWRDVIYTAATEQRSRLQQGIFEDWMTEQLAKNVPWDQLVRMLITATGSVQEQGATALFFAHSADPAEVAAECSRIFLGIQLQCANCHDHPTDVWKREQFHELAAYFTRVEMRRTDANGTPLDFTIAALDNSRARGRDFIRENPEQFFRMVDANRDGNLTKAEVQRRNGPTAKLFDRALEFGDRNRDGMLNLDELKALPQPDQPGRGSTEYFMPNLQNPAARGTRIDPKWFVDNSAPGAGLSDEQRRSALARQLTSADNPWFAKAIVNRLWGELLGQAFYLPIDDLGPTRTPDCPEALELLATGFVEQGFNLRWLIQTIFETQAYQRALPHATAATVPFAAAIPSRLRADVIFSELLQALDVPEPKPRGNGSRNAIERSPRFAFDVLFGADPSTPKADVSGNVPQALFVMNSPLLQGAQRARLTRLVREFPNADDAVSELYLSTLARLPSESELTTCRDYLGSSSTTQVGYEDLFWSLINSSEFISRR